MDTLFPDWNSEIGVEFPLPIQRKSLGFENELVELLWQNGELVLQSQTNKKQSQDPPKTSGGVENSSTGNSDVLWMDCPIDVSFEKEFCANLFPESLEVGKTDNVVGGVEWGGARECSAKTIGSSNQVTNQGCHREVGPQCESVEMGTLEQVITSSCKGSGSGSGSDTTCWKTESLSGDKNKHKRKSRDGTESKCPSAATELLESGIGNKASSQKSRRSRVAKVHNMSERRRRDRINEKMRALQELIPHSNKSDKASMLDEAIEYMKSLQPQLQLLWMGTGMAAPMMIPGMQPYMGMIPTIQNLMRLSRLPLVNPAMTMSPSPNQGAMLCSINYNNSMQNPSFPEQYANYMGFNSVPNGPQPMNIFNYGSHSVQQNQMLAPQLDNNRLT